MQPRVGIVELGPGPLADVTSAPTAALLGRLEHEAASAPRALLLVAPDGLGCPEDRPSTPKGLEDPAAALAGFPAPTVAAWDGPAVGAGAELVLAADLRVIGPRATMAFPEVALGQLPCWGGTQRLTHAVGVSLALRMLLLGEVTDASTLAHAGLGVVSDDPVVCARELAHALSRGAPRAQQAARDAILRGVGATLADGVRLESDLNLLLSTTADRAEGIRAFFAKEPPQFTGE
jgi:enoyl-CoA hydratase/carnithine racemase